VAIAYALRARFQRARPGFTPEQQLCEERLKVGRRPSKLGVGQHAQQLSR
jgi:hypothetical protein